MALTRTEAEGTDQVGEVVSVLSGHQPAGVAEAGDVLDVGLKSRRVGLEHDVNESWEEVVSRGRLLLGDPNGAEDVFTAARDAPKFVPGNPLRVHLNDICNKRTCKNTVFINAAFANRKLAAVLIMDSLFSSSEETGSVLKCKYLLVLLVLPS